MESTHIWAENLQDAPVGWMLGEKKVEGLR